MELAQPVSDRRTGLGRAKPGRTRLRPIVMADLTGVQEQDLPAPVKALLLISSLNITDRLVKP